MEFANNGDLAYRITEKQKKGETFEEAEIWQIFIQVVKGLNELHNLNIFHRDIKVPPSSRRAPTYSSTKTVTLSRPNLAT